MSGVITEQGWELISANFNPVNIVKTHWAAYEAGAESAGLKADRANWRIARSIFVAETDAEAEEYLASGNTTLHKYYDYMLRHLKASNFVAIFKTHPDMKDEEVTVEHCLKEMVIAGGPETVRDRILDLVDRVGPFGTLLTTFNEWDDVKKWRRSYELLARTVLPAVNAKLDQLKPAA